MTDQPPLYLIPDDEWDITFERSGGPGGQNVNKVSTRAVLTFDVSASTALSFAQKETLRKKLGARISGAGILRLTCDTHRTQAGNRREIVERFKQMVATALRPRKKRRPTRPSRGSVERRLNAKKQASQRKQNRSRRGDD